MIPLPVWQRSFGQCIPRADLCPLRGASALSPSTCLTAPQMASPWALLLQAHHGKSPQPCFPDIWLCNVYPPIISLKKELGLTRQRVFQVTSCRVHILRIFSFWGFGNCLLNFYNNWGNGYQGTCTFPNIHFSFLRKLRNWLILKLSLSCSL